VAVTRQWKSVRVLGGWHVETSDQSFAVPDARSSGAPDHILIHVADGVSAATVAQRLRAVLPLETVKVQTAQEAARRIWRSCQRSARTIIIFGFWCSWESQAGHRLSSLIHHAHLSEYATFKAMGYGQSFLRHRLKKPSC
jgi:putative ABC transport system permease protein